MQYSKKAVVVENVRQKLRCCTTVQQWLGTVDLNYCGQFDLECDYSTNAKSKTYRTINKSCAVNPQYEENVTHL